MNKNEGMIYTYEFSIIGEHYFPEQDYVLITTNPDEDRMETLMNLFYTHNQDIYCCQDAFIIPQKTFDTVLKPLMNKCMLETVLQKWEEDNN